MTALEQQRIAEFSAALERLLQRFAGEPYIEFAAGIALALMETLADYGTVAYFAVNTFTTGIYRAWFSLGDRVAAAQLAAMLLSFVLFLLMVERVSRGRARYNNTTGRNRPLAGARLGLPALDGLAAAQLDQRGRAAAEGDMGEVDPGLELQELARHVEGGAGA